MAKKINFPLMVENGENPNGVRTEGSFGVSHGGIGEDYYTQYNFGTNDAGPRWGGRSPEMVPLGMGVVTPDTNDGAQNKGARLRGGR